MPKGPARRRLEQCACSLLVRWASLTAALLPLRALWAVADGAAYTVMVISPRRQRMAEANIAAAFPALSPAECRGIRRRSVRNLTRTMLEMFKLPALSKEHIGSLVEGHAFEPVREALGQGSGVMVITAHFGNWELMGAYASEYLAPLTVVARDESNGGSGQVLNRLRRSHGTHVVGRTDAREMLRVLSAGGLLAVLPDQHAASGGQLLDFLGRPAWTFTGPAQLAARTGARVFSAFGVRDFGGPFRVEVGPEITLVSSGDRAADVTENTRRINAAIEGAIRAHPDNWLWLHNRWKGQRGQAEAESSTAESHAHAYHG